MLSSLKRYDSVTKGELPVWPIMFSAIDDKATKCNNSRGLSINTNFIFEFRSVEIIQVGGPTLMTY